MKHTMKHSMDKAAQQTSSTIDGSYLRTSGGPGGPLGSKMLFFQSKSYPIRFCDEKLTFADLKNFK